MTSHAILSSVDGSIQAVADWPVQLATLTRVAWTGPDGVCHFPYRPLCSAEFWRNEVATQWQRDELRSWVMVLDGRIVAHAALVRKGWDHFELGRWVAFADAPKGAVTLLCKEALKSAKGKRVHVECTQAHGSSQWICESELLLRFAGIGTLKRVNGVWWDIIFYDNASLPHFTLEDARELGAIGNPLGKPNLIRDADHGRLEEILRILTAERDSPLPPTKFHVLVHRLKLIHDIVWHALTH